ncbi:class I SAM-dependent methyltransferase [Zeaxanthinibacter sp. PT1]|uniref:class I SAM-dependent methyltransferase n=1 Tax=Zeaxanthinibacter TaxID=561554 RepID=UPI00234A319D|nr:class I SAM-dependent methyltransferase [Zeaxanthinibacter sp. PT1]MDC6350635.1 class I SAM-dependent methyltransferase [Zeaxanthinibacter sp. PT1]
MKVSSAKDLEFNEQYLKLKDHALSGEEFALFRNADLDLLRTFPVPDKLEGYYKGKYISHSDSNASVLDKIYQLVKRFMLYRKMRMVAPYINSGRNLLDIGAGSGDWIKYAQGKSWKCTGMEPNATARNNASRKGVALVDSLDQLQGKKFDLITMWHVLEHLTELENTIQQLELLLSRDGLLTVAVPNFNSKDAEHYKEFWAAYDVPRHIWHFSRKAVHQIFQEHGFKVVKEKPLIFDAFYVSLLSEKYKHGRNRFLHGLWNGLKSNLAARSTGEYSSVVYLLKREL